jgi:N utilization substance protein B
MAEQDKETGADTWTPGTTPAGKDATPKRARRGAIWNPANRRNSREWAVQILFLMDANPPAKGIDQAIEEFWGLWTFEEPMPERNLAVLAETLAKGAWSQRDAIDARIESYLDNWTIDRIGGVEKAALRLAIYEMFHCEDTPPVVALNEAVDIVKFFSTIDSSAFVNGVLDRAIKDVKRNPREAKTPAWLRNRRQRLAKKAKA